MNTRFLFITALVAAGLGHLPTHASPLFEENFEADTVGSSPATSGSWPRLSAPANSLTVRDESSASPFGTPNQYLELSDTGNTTSLRLQSADMAGASGTVTTLALDFREPSSGGGDGMVVGYAMTGSDLNTAGHRLRFNLDDGQITGLTSTAANTYSLDSSYRLYVVFNDTDTPFTHANGTVAARTADVWLERAGSSTPIFAGSVSASNSQTTSYSIGLRSFSSSLQTLWVDDVALESGVMLTDSNPQGSGPSCTLACSHPAVAEAGTVTLQWSGSQLPQGSTFEITSDAGLSFSNGTGSGDAIAGSGQVDVTLATIGSSSVTFSLVIRDDSDAQIATAQVTVEAFDYSVPERLPHPSVTSSSGQLAAMKDQVLNHPDSLAKAGWDAMLATSYASLSYVHTPQEIVSVVPSGGNASEAAFRNDCQAARCHALQWVVTGNPAHRDKAMAILTDMGKTFRRIVSTGSAAQIQLESAWALPVWLSAADILRYHDGGSAGWDPADVAAFHHFARILHDQAKLAMPRQNNWGVSAALAVMAYGAWSDDPVIFQTGLDGQLGLLDSISQTDGEIAETCRDVWHPQYSVVSWVDAAELARNLGHLDLYEATFDGQATPRLAMILEYFANLLLGNTAHPCGGGWGYNYLGQYDRFDNYEVAYNHYIKRKGVTYLPVFAEMVEDFWRNDVGADAHFLLWSRLTHGDNAYVALPATDTYEQWAAEQFTAFGITDTAQTARTGDFNRDGIPNRLHYWILTNPRDRNFEAVFSTAPAQAPDELRVRFVERPEAESYGRTFLYSSDLGAPPQSWSVVSPTSMQIIEDRGNHVLREAAFSVAGSRGFFMIRYPSP